jgi:phage gpG-like protein
MSIEVNIVGGEELATKYDRLPAAIHAGLLKKITALSLQLEAKVKQKLSGEVLNVVTGNLRRSIFSRVEDQGDTITATVGSSGVIYAGIHEYGGTIAAHDIIPNRAQALRFMIGDKVIFARRVHIPPVEMPERSYLRSTFTEMKEEIVSGIKEAAAEAVVEAVKK